MDVNRDIDVHLIPYLVESSVDAGKCIDLTCVSHYLIQCICYTLAAMVVPIDIY